MFITRIWYSSFQERCDVLNEKIFHTVKVKLSKIVALRAMKAYEGVKV